jgi:hypothetical protein
MNNFDGKLHLYPEIFIDNFTSERMFDKNIRVYILTHFHEEHMINLESLRFLNLLKEDNILFLCSDTIKKLILSTDKYKHLSEFCKNIETNLPFEIKLNNKNEKVNLSLLTIEHSSFNVIVFLEGSRGNVLFTGNFLYKKKHITM